MLGKRGLQRGLFEADTLYSDFVGRDTFYGWLASQRGTLFRDEDFAPLYGPGSAVRFGAHLEDVRVIGVHAVDLVWGFGTLHCLTQQQPA